MKKTIILVILTALMGAIIAGLFAVMVLAPEPWQDKPWTIWERCAQGLLLVLGWPLFLAALLFSPLGLVKSCICVNLYWIACFIFSGAFWVMIMNVIINKIHRKRSPNHGVVRTR